MKPVLGALTSADGGLGVRAAGGAGHLLLALQLEPVAAGEHEHAPPRLAAEREAPVVHAVREAARVTCAGTEDRRRSLPGPHAWAPRPTVPSRPRTTGGSGD